MINAVDPNISTNDNTLPLTNTASGQANKYQIFFHSPVGILIRNYIPKIVVIILTIQGLIGLYHSMKFIFLDIEVLEQQLAKQQIFQAEVNQLANKAILTVFSTIINMFVAIRLAFLKSNFKKIVNTIIGFLLIVSHPHITGILSQLNSTQLLVTSIINGLKSFITVETQINETINTTVPKLLK